MNDFTLFKEPPPRPVPVGMIINACRHYRIMQKYVGIAAICFGCFYTPVFIALNAPREILGGAGSIGLLGILLLVSRVLGKHRIAKLLRTGIYAEGEVIALAAAEPEEPRTPTSYELRYRFRDQTGREWHGRTWTGWQHELRTFREGDAFPICYNPARPGENIALLAIKG
jgi:hypothetical protein